MGLLELPEVWISSIAHLDKMHEINRKNGWWKPILGIQKIDPGFPQTKMGGFVFPIVYFSTGALNVCPDEVAFTAKEQPPKPKVIFKNVNFDLTFYLKIHEIEDVSIYKYPNPILKKFNYPWVLIAMKNGDSVLISSAMQFGQIEKGLKETAKLYQYIQDRVA